jgi:DNA-binding CsgD family transcriptional regulator
MREVSMRMIHFLRDLARASRLDERALLADLQSLVPVSGKEPDWIDWDDFIEAIERFERVAGGADGVGRAMRDAAPAAYPELRAFASVFVHPIPAFRFVMTRFMPTMCRHLAIETIEELGDHRVRWTQTIPEPYRASEAFHRGTIALVEMFPRHLDLAEARIERATITPREAEFIARFPAVDLLATSGIRTVSYAASGLVVQLDDAFSRISATLRGRPRATTNGDAAPASNRAGGATASGDVREWADRLLLSPRQREVFGLLAEGRANKDIANTLRCSERNIEFHVGRILRAAKVTSRAELLVKVLSSPRA